MNGHEIADFDDFYFQVDGMTNDGSVALVEETVEEAVVEHGSNAVEAAVVETHRDPLVDE